jgi:hypothetical protein
MNAEAAPGLRRVALGLGFVFAGLALEVFTFCAVLVLGAFLSGVWQVAGPVFTAATVPGLVLHLVGLLLCLAIPAESQARRTLVLAIALLLLAQVMVVVEVAGAGLGWLPTVGVPLGLSTVARVLGIASSVAFILFLRRLAHYLNYGEGELNAEGVLVLWALTFVIWLVGLGVLLGLLGLVAAGNLLAGGLAAITMVDLVVLFVAALVVLAVLVVGLWAFVKYCNLLIELRNVIRRELDTLAEELRLKGPGLRPS